MALINNLEPRRAFTRSIEPTNDRTSTLRLSAEFRYLYEAPKRAYSVVATTKFAVINQATMTSLQKNAQAMIHRYLTALLLCTAPLLAYAEPVWLLVDTSRHQLSVMQNSKTHVTFNDIAIGRGGVAKNRRQGDKKTPLGEFQISWVNPSSRFRLFFGLNFPTMEYASDALSQGLISSETYAEIEHASYQQLLPPQNTALGGNLGIHGVGNGNPTVHQRLNWTEGCIALSNQQIEQLAKWVRIGTKVVIR